MKTTKNPIYTFLGAMLIGGISGSVGFCIIGGNIYLGLFIFVLFATEFSLSMAFKSRPFEGTGHEIVLYLSSIFFGAVVAFGGWWWLRDSLTTLVFFVIVEFLFPIGMKLRA